MSVHVTCAVERTVLSISDDIHQTVITERVLNGGEEVSAWRSVFLVVVAVIISIIQFLTCHK